MRRILPLVLAPALALGACDADEPTAPGLAPGAASARVEAATGPEAAAEYTVTIENLTTAGQPLTPPLAVVHRRPLSLFTVGQAAGFGLKEIAENGNLGPMHERLAGEHHVADLVIALGDPPPILPGQSRAFTVRTERGAKYFSFVSMLICTNDGFTAVDGIRLPGTVGETATAYSASYDAGTEQNTEDFANLVPPCQALSGVMSDDEGMGMSEPSLAENGVVHPHEGIQGIADLVPEVHGWTDPVSRVVIERIR